ncbi:MAG TPA: tail fiber protein [Thermomicrobiales bacterium]|nr:tail fiber protein [Thermomicrobiales bacterium]
MDPFLGEIRMFGGNFAPKGWAFCNGQLLPIAQNTALFSLLGTTYGGNGQTTFGLPDLRGRAPLHWGQGPGLSPYTQGEQGGQEQITLISGQMPTHAHAANAVAGGGNNSSPAGNVWAASTTRDSIYASGSPGTTMNPAAIGNAGGNQPHENRQPYLTVSFIIALEGIYPTRP